MLNCSINQSRRSHHATIVINNIYLYVLPVSKRTEIENTTEQIHIESQIIEARPSSNRSIRLQQLDSIFEDAYNKAIFTASDLNTKHPIPTYTMSTLYVMF